MALKLLEIQRSEARAARAASIFQPTVIVAALLVIPAMALHDPSLGPTANAIGLWLDAAIWSVFAAELVVMLAVSPSPRTWLRHNYFSPLIVILTPPFVFTALSALRFLRVLQLLRLLRAARVARRVFSLDGLRYAALIAAGTIVVGGVAFAVVEEGSGLTATDGIWWAITTVTTVGYGDIAPTTEASRVIAITVMGVGIGFVALLTGAAAERFLVTSATSEGQDEERREILDEIRALRAEVAELRGVTSAGSHPRNDQPSVGHRRPGTEGAERADGA